MKIGLIDCDSHNFPNLALMKISAWHKSKGDHVEWYQPLFSGHMDIVYKSKVFSFSPDYEWLIDAEKIMGGGVQAMLYLWLMERRFTIKRKIRHYHQRLNIFILITHYIQS